MANFDKYLVEAKLGNFVILTNNVSRSMEWRISTHEVPGRKGDNKQHNGRKSIVDNVSALLTVTDVANITAIADSEKPIKWQNPLLSAFVGYIKSLQIPEAPDLLGYFRASFVVEQAYDPKSQNSVYKGILTPASAQTKANAVMSNVLADLDAVGPVSGQAGTDLTGATAGLTATFGAMDSTFDAIADAEANWRDLSRDLDEFTNAAQGMARAVRNAEATLTTVAADILDQQSIIVQTVRNAVDSIKRTAETAATFVVTAPSDLYTMMVDAGVDITEDTIRALMRDNLIEDPLMILPGARVSIPV